MILILSSSEDAHAAVVLDELHRRGAEATLLDLSAFPRELRLSLSFDGVPVRRRLVGAGLDLDFDQCRVVWWRRPQPFRLHSELAMDVDRSFAYSEAQEAFGGLWLTLDAFWINHPTRDEEASRKVHQLHLAQQLGLRIPETCITSDPAEARAFIEARGAGRTIYKAFGGTEQAWRETRLLRPNELDLLDNVRFAPLIFQEHVAATADLRITVVGDEIFPAAIRVAEGAYPVDFRMSMDEATIEATTLPASVQKRLRALMKRLGLVYGAIDMRLTPDGDHVFLEINPAGQWLFVEQATQQPISAAMAALMVKESGRPAGRGSSAAAGS